MLLRAGYKAKRSKGGRRSEQPWRPKFHWNQQEQSCELVSPGSANCTSVPRTRWGINKLLHVIIIPSMIGLYNALTNNLRIPLGYETLVTTVSLHFAEVQSFII
jgi:hypothetical protein